MKLNRVTHDPGQLLEFYEEGLTALGALCERTWHDRLEVVAEGRPATLWNPGGALHEVELQFVPADATSAREAAREIFPGCPLTFHLAETLRPSPMPLERFVLPGASPLRPPDAAVAEKIWRAHFPDTTRWHLTSAWKPDFHFSLLAIVRCEIQAIDQHWSLHRIAASLVDGEPDDTLAHEIGYQQTAGEPDGEIIWPPPNPARWRELLQWAVEKEAADQLDEIRTRQENSLRRELERIDDYFDNYERELAGRTKRAGSENLRIKSTDRLAAAKAEHARRRSDQVARHEIGAYPHVDALVLIAETAWAAHLQVARAHRSQEFDALFVPRSRRWKMSEQKDDAR